MNSISKRDGRTVPFDQAKIVSAIWKAMKAMNHGTEADAARVAADVTTSLSAKAAQATPSVEDVQDAVELALMHAGFEDVAKDYILYRARRTEVREKNAHLMRILGEITSKDAAESDLKRDNANVDGDSAMGTMLQYGTSAAKEYNEKFLLRPEQAHAYHDGYIHIHDFDFYALTMTCCQIDLLKLFKGGFSTGHGYLREPNDIRSYAALACIAIQSNQNDQHGGQSVAQFDRGLAPGVAKTFAKRYRVDLSEALSLLAPEGAAVPDPAAMKARFAAAEAKSGEKPSLEGGAKFDAELRADLVASGLPEAAAGNGADIASRETCESAILRRWRANTLRLRGYLKLRVYVAGNADNDDTTAAGKTGVVHVVPAATAAGVVGRDAGYGRSEAVATIS